MSPGKASSRWRIAVGLGSCGVASGAQALYDQLEKRADPGRVTLEKTGCAGLCHREPMLELWSPKGERWTYVHLDAEAVDLILDEHVGRQRPVDKYLLRGADRAESVERFLGKQKKIVLENCGLIDPESIGAYTDVGGYRAIRKALGEMTPAGVIAEVTASGLRGRGGAGFPTGVKWKYCSDAEGERKYLICNGDEGDPGAFMDRGVMESDPHRVLEGMMVAAYAIGASAGFIYVRAEYPLAVKRMGLAIEEARAAGLLGERILGSAFSFDLQVREGAGAFVCGEETALIMSIEGERGMPRMRPPFPAQKGLWGCPTIINNVETLANLPWILNHGAKAFAAMGTEKSKGTKVFSVVGKIRQSGLVEVPMGITLREILHEMCGGSATGRPIKAIQTGGPSGGCIPANLFDTRIDYEELVRHGAIMGSGGMIVMDEDTCMVDMARFFVAFTAKESCGKCAPCRLGTQRLLGLLTRITEGKGAAADLQTLEEFGRTIKTTSLCGLGQTAPNPVLTTLRYFRHEYEEHIRERRCRAGVCQALLLAPCENSCPLHMNIPGYLQLLKEDRLDEAFDLVMLDNPLPGSTGRVCQHPCEHRCRRATLDASVNMREVHRYISDTVFTKTSSREIVRRFKQHKMSPTGKRVAIIGAGPAGLTAAFYLALLGHKVAVYEAAAKPGGMLRYSLPPYRLPKETLDREIALIRGLGVRFVCNTALGRDVALDELTRDHDAVFLSIGTWKEKDLGVPGRELQGVVSALDFLKAVAHGRKIELGGRVAVIGGGNAAIDSARTALRLGAEVTIVYRRSREDMPAIAEETRQALEEGANLIPLAAPVRLLGDNGRVSGMEVARTIPGEFDSHGRRTPVLTDEKYVVRCDTVIEAIGETVEDEVVRRLGLPLARPGTIQVDPWTLQTGNPKVFAGGDVVTGSSNVVSAMAFGKKAAGTIDRQLTGEDRFRQLWPPFAYDDTPPPQGQGGPRNVAKIARCGVRRANFNEVSQALSARDARAEALRCLRCDIKAPAEDHR